MKIILLLLGLIVAHQCCVSRADAIAKGMQWVRDHVPYSQTGSHEGYRTDCSGFASCIWRLSKPGLTTRDFVGAKVCAQTTKDHLERGDFILAPNHHVAIFDGWVDSGKTTYWLMQEEGTNYGTVRRQQKYPYGSATDFFPCKVLIACSENQQTQNLKVEAQE